MNLREWALIAFTLMSQMSVGAFVVLGIVHFFARRKAGIEQADRLSDRALLAIGPVLVLGIIASFLHLGNPLNAPLAILNFGNSWLSREIVFAVLFGVLGAAFAIMQWRKIGSMNLRSVIAWAAAIIGLLQVFSMAMVYMLPLQPYWNTLFGTPLAFFAATFLLGSLAIGSALVANYAYIRRANPDCAEEQCSLLRSVVKGIAVACVVLLGIELVAAPLQLTLLASLNNPAAAESSALLYSDFGWIYGLRLALAFIGAGIFALFLYRSALTPGRERLMSTLVYGAFAVVLIAEVMGRFLFYAAHVKVGL